MGWRKGYETCVPWGNIARTNLSRSRSRPGKSRTNTLRALFLPDRRCWRLPRCRRKKSSFFCGTVVQTSRGIASPLIRCHQRLPTMSIIWAFDKYELFSLLNDYKRLPGSIFPWTHHAIKSSKGVFKRRLSKTRMSGGGTRKRVCKRNPCQCARLHLLQHGFHLIFQLLLRLRLDEKTCQRSFGY